MIFSTNFGAGHFPALTSATVRDTTPTASAATIALFFSSSFPFVSSFPSSSFASFFVFGSLVSLSDILINKNPRPGILTGLSLRPFGATPFASGVAGSLGRSISVASLVALFSRMNEHVTTNPAHPSPCVMAVGAVYSNRSRDSSASAPSSPPPPEGTSKVLRRLAPRSVPSSARGALRRISCSASRRSASRASSSIVSCARKSAAVRFHLVASSQNRRRPVRTEVAFSNPRIWRRARHKPTSIAGG